MAVAASRLVRSSGALQFDSFSPARSVHVSSLTSQGTVEMKRKRKAVVVAKCSFSENVILERERKGGVGDLGSVAAGAAEAALGVFKPWMKRKSWPLQAEMIVETVSMNTYIYMILFVFILFLVGGTVFL